MLEALLGLGFLAYIGWAALIGLVICGLERDSGPLTFLALVAGCVLVWFTNNMGIPSVSGVLTWLNLHFFQLLWFVAGYVVVGALWGVVKWFFFAHNKADVYEANRDMWQKQWDQATESYKASYSNSYKVWATKTGVFPTPGQYKATITMWMVYWPWSALWTLLNDPLKRIYRLIYQNLVTVYEKITSVVFGRFAEFN